MRGICRSNAVILFFKRHEKKKEKKKRYSDDLTGSFEEAKEDVCRVAVCAAERKLVCVCE